MTQLVLCCVCFTVSCLQLKGQLVDLLNSILGIFIYLFIFCRRERPPRLRKSFLSRYMYTKYIITNKFSNCDSRLIHFKIKAKGLFHKVEGCIYFTKFKISQTVLSIVVMQQGISSWNRGSDKDFRLLHTKRQ